MNFEDILKLLIGSVESKGNPGRLVEACEKLNMKTYESFNLLGDPEYCTGYDFIFNISKGERARLQIVEFLASPSGREEGNLMVAGFQVVYKDGSLLDIEFASLYRSLKNYYTTNREIFIDRIEFANEISQCHLMKHKLNNQFVLDVRITNKEVSKRYIRKIASLPRPSTDR